MRGFRGVKRKATEKQIGLQMAALTEICLRRPAPTRIVGPQSGGQTPP